jgi:hypothetical protein
VRAAARLTDWLLELPSHAQHDLQQPNSSSSSARLVSLSSTSPSPFVRGSMAADSASANGLPGLNEPSSDTTSSRAKMEE